MSVFNCFSKQSDASISIGVDTTDSGDSGKFEKEDASQKVDSKADHPVAAKRVSWDKDLVSNIY